MIKIICVCGARPNFMKMAPLIRAFNANSGFETLLVLADGELSRSLWALVAGFAGTALSRMAGRDDVWIR